MNLAIDTNAYSSNIQGSDIVGGWFNSKNHLYIPIIVIAELRAGFANGNRREINDQLLDDFLSSPFSDILQITEATCTIYAEIFTKLRRKGRPINTNDMWIAALCIENKLPLLTQDHDFSHIKGLELL